MSAQSSQLLTYGSNACAPTALAAWRCGDGFCDLAEPPDRVAQRAQLARRGALRRRLACQPLEVANAVESCAQRRTSQWIADQCADTIQPLLDCCTLRERSQEPLPQQPASHRREGVVEHIEHRAVAIATSQRLDELEIAPCHVVERHDAPRALDERRCEVRDPCGLQLMEIAQQCTCGADRGRILGAQAESLERRHAELAAERVARQSGVEFPAVSFRQEDAVDDHTGGPEVDAPSEQQFPWRESSKDRSRVGHDHRGEAQLAGREVTPSDPEHGLRFGSHSTLSGRGRHDGDRTEEVVAHGLQQLVVERRTRRDSLDDLATHNALGELRVLDLIAQRNAEPLLDQPPDVLVHCLDGDAGEGNRRGGPIVPRRQRQPERPGPDLRVFEEHLEEVTHAEQQDRILVPGFDFPVLLHERGRREHGANLWAE